MLRWILAPAFGAGLLLASAASALAGTEEDLSQAKIYLKDYLKDINQKYPFSDWEKQLMKARGSLDRLRSKPGFNGEAFDASGYAALDPMARDVQDLTKHRADVDKLIKELYVANIVSKVDGMFFRNGKHWDPDSKIAFQRALMPYEAGSLKPKTVFQANVAALDRDFRAVQTAWLYSFAQDYLGRRVEEHLRSHDLAKIESMYDDYSLQLDYWSRQVDANAKQTQNQLQQLSQKYENNKGWLRQNLEGLLDVLNTDMLFSDLLEYARTQKVDFTIEVEDKIEASLKERNQATLAPIQQRIALWKNFAANLREKTSVAKARMDSEQRDALARIESERREAQARADAARKEALAKADEEHARQEQERIRQEQEQTLAEQKRKEEEQERIRAQEEQARMDALAAEQHKAEEEQREKFSKTLAELKTFTFKSETAVELDDESQQALKTKAGFLKTSYVRSGVNKLKVDKSHFSDTLALVQKFTVAESHVDFSKMSLEERSNQSAYTYDSPAGRTSQGDLENFVSEVALGSFSTYYSFLSYVAPQHWSPGRSISWTADRAADKAAQDRDFSYVDLVVDAHRKRSGGPTRNENTTNLPANMIVIFDPQGAIIRFQPFADIGEVSIRHNDLVGGKLYYKFLNYSADRQHIYLNGIDAEMKVASPVGKS